MPVSIFRTTQDGDILIANKALVEMLEYPDQKELRKVMQRFFMKTRESAYSGRKRSVIPIHSGHLFRLIPVTFFRTPESVSGKAMLDNFKRMSRCESLFDREGDRTGVFMPGV